MTFYQLMSKVFPKRCREIPAINGGILLQQIRITKGAYLQHFVKPEPKEVFHVHRWKRMRSYVLFGSYTEERFEMRYFADTPTPMTWKITHNFFSTFTMDKSVKHRVDTWSPRCWTLFIFGESDETWGYYDKFDNYTPWAEYIPSEIRVDSL